MNKSRNWIELKERKYSQIKKIFTNKEKSNKTIPLSVTYNRTFPNISKIVNTNSKTSKRLLEIIQQGMNPPLKLGLDWRILNWCNFQGLSFFEILGGGGFIS